MCYDFILQNLYYDFIDIFQSFGLKPYLAESVEDASDLNMKVSDAEIKLREEVAKTEKELQTKPQDKKKSDKK